MSSSSPPKTLPDYQPQMAAYHQGFAAELKHIIDQLPVPPGGVVLDMACGDGTYTALLAHRVGPNGLVIALDINPAYLDLARTHVQQAGLESRTRFIQASIDKLPVHPGGFDLCWCAQSLYSLPEPVAALRALAQAARPGGGTVAILENDTLHQILLPWPVELELAVRAAEHQALINESARPRKFYAARRLGTLFHEAGLENCRLTTFSHDRQAPVGPHERLFLESYLQDLRERVSPLLSPLERETFELLADPHSLTYLLDSPHLAFTLLDNLAIATKA